MAGQTDPWNYWASGHEYQITFNGKDVGGGGHARPSGDKRRDAAFFCQSAAITLRDCRAKHAVDPFDPAKHQHIWNWLRK